MNEQTKLRLINEVNKKSSSNIESFSRESANNGWTYFTNKILREHLPNDI